MQRGVQLRPPAEGGQMFTMYRGHDDECEIITSRCP